MRAQKASLYGKKDPRALPAYTVPDTAHYLLVPPATVRSWVAGRPYPTKSGKQFFEPVIHLPKPHPPVLSFVNLVETHVLDAIRRKHQIPLDKVRIAVDYLREEFGSEHTLADYKLQTDGLDLFVEEFGRLVNISKSGQLAMRNLLAARLQRIERNAAGMAIRLYPFTRKRDVNEPKVIVIDPSISFGRPVLAGTGIPTAVIAERYKAGEAREELARDYGVSNSDIDKAIRCELPVEAA